MGYIAHHSHVSIHPLNYQDCHWLTAESFPTCYPLLKGAAFTKVVDVGVQSPGVLPQWGTFLISLPSSRASMGGLG